MLRCRALCVLLILIFCTWPGTLSLAQKAVPLTTEQRQTFDQGLQTLQESLQALGDRPASDIADASIFSKGLQWALLYDQQFSPRDIALMKRAIVRGKQRIEALAANKKTWSTRKGKLALGYVSAVDNSVQPYGVIVPENYDPAQPIRLDVVLHGSSRPVGMSELRFIARFDEGDEKQSTAPDKPYIELHPLGRVENCYRWAGETDVFEAIEDVCRRYNIDRRRIVLRGMSMGASGTWHLGLKHPDYFVAIGPYCGYVDTHHFSETPLKNFVKVGPLPPHQELGLHMLDSIDYAANAGVVPAIACIGEKDVFFQAHVLMGKAMQQEGLTMVNLISPGTGHVIDPVTHAEQMRRIGLYVDKGLDRQPQQLRFVTWTLKYNRCHWLEVLGLQQHYAKAVFAAQIRDDAMEVTELQNITRFAIDISRLSKVPQKLRIGKTELSLSPAITTQTRKIVIERKENVWSLEDRKGKSPRTGKRPGMQGPIDDAFSSPFLCVRGTGQPWNAAVQAYSTASLKRFADEWQHYFRGELPIKNDTDVTEEDIRTRNLILFGDPGSNRLISKVLPDLPLEWTREKLRLGNQEYPAEKHVPALIAPNPLAGANRRYVVLNSGHTFREAELAKLNYLLFPRWGDWAVLQIDPSYTDSTPIKESVLRAGYFDEQWK
ncbi:Prolyl oligopeptidase family protein [Gimesia panareensis]|uniref:Prolyl oligopeptidase family protein n=1 Tax=Gimesia panareensis TaxID=2527978 RepID=A0A518FT71_9PLAN|nr:prolyl oligopeptidase family serine peptidase [Gimesia panareensis]QDV19542.1 Prolyl oligopeptidase family protein [Gimesia panareensis]